MTSCIPALERTGVASVVVMGAHVRQDMNPLINQKEKVRLKPEET
jgi:hypothetical protein